MPSIRIVKELQRVEDESDCGYLLGEIPGAVAQTMEGVNRVATIVRAMKEFAHPERQGDGARRPEPGAR